VPKADITQCSKQCRVSPHRPHIEKAAGHLCSIRSQANNERPYESWPDGHIF
jgi:hypothetical protein